MILVQRKEGNYVFQLGTKERLMLQQVVRRYPAMPPGHFRLSRSSESSLKPEDQQMLTESIQATQEVQQQRVRQLMQGSRWMVRAGHGIRLRLCEDEVELLLQVLNDVRVGCWVRLGCPNPEAACRGEEKAKAGWDGVMMDLAGFLQNSLLEAIASEPRRGSCG